jgi:hypothetical protein
MKAIDKEKVVKLLKRYALDHGHPDLYKNSEDLASQILKCNISFDMDNVPLKNPIRKRPRLS